MSFFRKLESVMYLYLHAPRRLSKAEMRILKRICKAVMAYIEKRENEAKQKKGTGGDGRFVSKNGGKTSK